jgi:hypothetical protein
MAIMNVATLKKLIQEKGYEYQERRERPESPDVNAGRPVIVYAIKGEEELRLGIKCLLLQSTVEYFKQNAYKKL